MRIHNKLDEILNQPAKVKILRFLFSNNVEITGRAVARGSGLSVSHSYEMLQDMCKEGIVEVKRRGNALLYSLRLDNHIVKNILKPLYQKERNIYKDIIIIIKKILESEKKSICSIAIFGSVAAKTENFTSDIDLLVITRDTIGKHKVDNLMDNLTAIMAKKFNVEISPYLLTVLEARNKYKQKAQLMRSIIDNNRLIYGEPIERILA
jgi:predicted nucleotidyltransferase